MRVTHTDLVTRTRRKIDGLERRRQVLIARRETLNAEIDLTLNDIAQSLEVLRTVVTRLDKPQPAATAGV